MMNVYNSKNGFTELSLNNQSEMQLCRLNESESRPNITLKKIGQELDIAETKCFTLKSEINYMMGVCRKAQTEIKGNRTLSDTSSEQIASPSGNPVLSASPVEYHNRNNNEIIAVDEILNCKSRKIHNNEQRTDGNFSITRLTPKSAQLSLKETTCDNDISKKLEHINLQEEEQKRLLNNYSVTLTVTPRVQLDKTFPPAITIPVPQKKMMEEERNVQSCYPEQMRKYFQPMLNVKKSVERLSSKGDENYICVLPSSAREDIKNLKLNLDMLNDTEVKSTGKNTYTSRINDRGENTKANDTVSKIRKRKRKLRSSVSKSTVTTKNTNVISGKEAKKRKPKGHKVALHESIPPKISKRSSDLLEIFHNTTIKSSNSVISNQYSKFDAQAKCIKKQRISDVNNKKTSETSCLESVNYAYQSHNKEDQQTHYSQSPKDLGMIPIQEHCNMEKCSDPSCLSSPRKIDKYERTIFNKYSDPTFIPNYEMPTLASKLKRANRYFSRFSIRNIPFIVATSVTPSHNLGLNIQQVLSIIKSRPINSDIAPLLMTKMSRGINPISLLLEQVNEKYEKSLCHMNSRAIKLSNSKEYLNINQGNKRLSILRLGQKIETPQGVHDMYLGNMKKISEKDNISEHVYKVRDDIYKNSSEQGTVSSPVAKKTNIQETVREKISTISLNKKNIVGDDKNQSPIAHNSKEIRNVFINLHNQFEQMYTKYKNLQSEVEKSNDKTLMKELSSMEKELNIKEEEINAVISLYKEVIMLKQQMKLLHEKNSLVCIATKSATESYKNTLPISFISGKSRSMNSAQIFNQRCGSIYSATRDPPTSFQLAALLRQIQTFHKQLQLVS